MEGSPGHLNTSRGWHCRQQFPTLLFVHPNLSLGEPETLFSWIFLASSHIWILNWNVSSVTGSYHLSLLRPQAPPGHNTKAICLTKEFLIFGVRSDSEPWFCSSVTIVNPQNSHFIWHVSSYFLKHSKGILHFNSVFHTGNWLSGWAHCSMKLC